jgi:hypothetical protein
MRLRRWDPAGPALRRRRRGPGFSYADADGRRLTDDETLRRIRNLVIPPAWTDVRICPWPHGHLQAVGIDDAGRRQYLYHPAWRAKKDREKFDRIRTFGRRLPQARKQIAADLNAAAAACVWGALTNAGQTCVGIERVFVATSRYEDFLAAVAASRSIAETLAVFAELIEAGKIRHFGLSNESSWGVMRFIAESDRGVGPRAASLQNAYNLVNRTFEVNLAEVCGREDVSLLAYSPLAQGYLTGKYDHGARPEGSRSQLFNRGQRYETPNAAEVQLEYNNLARSFGLEPALFANAFVTSRPFVTSNIIGATSIPQLNMALDAAEAVGLQEMVYVAVTMVAGRYESGFSPIACVHLRSVER